MSKIFGITKYPRYISIARNKEIAISKKLYGEIGELSLEEIQKYAAIPHRKRFLTDIVDIMNQHTSRVGQNVFRVKKNNVEKGLPKAFKSGDVVELSINKVPDEVDELKQVLLKTMKKNRLMYTANLTNAMTAKLNILKQLDKKQQAETMANLIEIVEQYPYRFTRSAKKRFDSDIASENMVKVKEEADGRLTLYRTSIKEELETWRQEVAKRSNNQKMPSYST